MVCRYYKIISNIMYIVPSPKKVKMSWARSPKSLAVESVSKEELDDVMPRSKNKRSEEVRV